MKNNFKKIILILLFSFIFISKAISDDFIFDISELEITENGNIYNGINGGKVSTDNGIVITSESFKYNKFTSLLESKGNAILVDTIKNITIKSEQIFYSKNKELAYTMGESSAVSNDGIEINANEFFKYNKLSSILEAKGDVKVNDKIKNIKIESDNIFYFKNEDKFTTKGKTKVNVEDKYFMDTSNLVLLRKDMLLSSKYKTIVTDTFDNLYTLNDFNYLIKDKILKGDKVELITNYLKDNSDKYFFNTGFFNFNNEKFIAKDVKIEFYKEMFDEEDNDPRLKGVSGYGDEFNTYLQKGTFTTCKNDDKCPPWIIESENVKHDKIKKQIIYKNAWLKLYDIPVAYFPKFFHPDPTVIRQSGFLRPRLENSDLLGQAINIPYFYVISDDKDITIKPRIYDNDKYILQNEYRQKTQNTNTIADFSYLKGYTTRVEGDTRDSRTHFFTNTIRKLNLENFLTSDLEIQFQKTSNDTYLKAFALPSPLLKGDTSVLETFVKIDLGNENYDFMGSFYQYETLSGLNSDRFQYILPSYSFTTSFEYAELEGDFNLSSYGNNTLKNTNNMRSSIINDLNYTTLSKYSDFGIETNYGVYTKNLNAIAKNDDKYKTSPQSEFMSGYMFDMSLPLFKENSDTLSTLKPKLNLRFSPHDMKNHKNSGGKISAGNIFSFNRLGLSDSMEDGTSLTFGIDYKREEKIKESNDKEKTAKDVLDFFELKLATVIRAKEEKNIPTTSTINKKNSNIVGAINYSSSEYLSLNYDFSIDNELKAFEYNSIDAELTYNNFSTTVKFLEETGVIGTAHILQNSFRYDFFNNNSLEFNTRRNKEINLTEYYDLVYEYKNDCLTARVEFKKQFYNNADIKPLEELYFSITIVPLGTFSPEPIIPKSVFNEDLKNILREVTE
jgi:LPS-assembly protein